ncbi:MAG TPA: GNAT family N-acetyltransferase [Candidatus Limnocylindrales bacterium]
MTTRVAGVAGLTFRPWHGPADYPGLAAANQRTRDAAGIAEVITTERMTRDYAHLVNCDLDRDLLVAERDGGIVGYARVDWRDKEDGGRTFQCITLLQPDAAEPAAYEAMLAWAEERQAAKARMVPDTDAHPGLLRAYTFGTETVLGDVLMARGWTRVGRGHEMVRPTLDDIPDRPLPSGIEVRPIANDPGARRRLWDAATEAFADERDEVAPTEEDWLGHLEDPFADPALWVVGFDGDEIASAAQGRIDPDENAHHGRERGYIEAVFTRRPWRRRGLARALLVRALVRLRDHGMTSAYLGVDGLNPNQAMDLYTDLGFAIANTSHDWSKPLTEEAPGAAE